MVFTLDTAARAAFKKLYGKAHTSNDKDIANESEPSNISAAAQSIFADPIPNTGAAAVAAGVAVSVSIPLVLDGSSNGKAYLATITGSVPAGLVGLTNPVTGTTYNTGQRVGFFIPQYLGTDFRAKLYDGVTEIPPLSAEDWVFDYYSGIVTSEDNLSLSSGSIEAYVYVGNLLSDTANNWVRDDAGHITNTNDGVVHVLTSLISDHDGYFGHDIGVRGDGYILGSLAINHTIPKEALYIKQGRLLLEDLTGNVENAVELSGYGGFGLDNVGEVSFGHPGSTNYRNRIAMIAGYTPSPYNTTGGLLGLYTYKTTGGTGGITITEAGTVGINSLATTHALSVGGLTSGQAQINLLYYDTTWSVNDIIGTLDWSGIDASVNASGVRARISSTAAGTAGATNMRFFTTADSSTTLNEVLTITSSQRIGILNSAPSYDLHVGTPTVTNTSVRKIVVGSATNGTSAAFVSAGTTGGGVSVQTIVESRGSTGVGVIGTSTNHPLDLRTNDSSALYIDTVGNVGINTEAPQAFLQVYESGSDSAITTFTQALDSVGFDIETDYSANTYTPGVFWSTQNNNGTRPKAGIFTQNTASGSYMYLGTSNAYGTGITNQAIAIDYSGNVGIGDTTPTEARLVVDNQSGGSPIVEFRNNSSSVFRLPNGMSQPVIGDALAAISTGGSVQWKSPVEILYDRLDSEYFEFDDFINVNETATSNGDPVGRFLLRLSSGAFATAEAKDGSHIGIIRMNSGGSAGNVAGVHSDYNHYRVDSGDETIHLKSWIHINNLSNNGVNEYTFVWGLSSNITDATTLPNNAVLIVMDGTSGNWRYLVRDNSVGTVTSTGTSMTTGWHKLELEFTLTNVTLMVDGATIISTGTNIPNGRSMYLIVGMIENTLGASQEILVDNIYIWLQGYPR